LCKVSGELPDDWSTESRVAEAAPRRNRNHPQEGQPDREDGAADAAGYDSAAAADVTTEPAVTTRAGRRVRMPVRFREIVQGTDKSRGGGIDPAAGDCDATRSRSYARQVRRRRDGWR